MISGNLCSYQSGYLRAINFIHNSVALTKVFTWGVGSSSDLVFIIVAAHKPRNLTVPLYHKILPVSISAYAVSVSRTDVLAVTGRALVVFVIYSCEKCNGKNITGAQGPVQTVYLSFDEPDRKSVV